MEGMAVAATVFGDKEKPADHKNVRPSSFYQSSNPIGLMLKPVALMEGMAVAAAVFGDREEEVWRQGGTVRT